MSNHFNEGQVYFNTQTNKVFFYMKNPNLTVQPQTAQPPTVQLPTVQPQTAQPPTVQSVKQPLTAQQLLNISGINDMPQTLPFQGIKSSLPAIKAQKRSRFRTLQTPRTLQPQFRTLQTPRTLQTQPKTFQNYAKLAQIASQQTLAKIKSQQPII